MRIAIVDTLYPAFVAEHYRQRPELHAASHAEQHAALMARSFGTSDAYSTNLREMGHEAIEILAGVEPLERAWERENESGLVRRATARLTRMRRRDDDSRRLVLAQIRHADPQVVYFQDLSVLPDGDLVALRREGRLVAGQIASPLPDPERLRCYGLLLSSFPHYVERFRTMGIDAEHLRIAFDARVLDRLRASGVDPSPAAERRDAVFVGGVDPQVHGEGVAALERVLSSVDVTVYGYGADRLPASSPVRRAWRGEAWGLEMYAILARAGVAINRHIGVAEGAANNMRLYEATGVGAVLVTEAAPNLPKLFAPGEEVVTYRDTDDLVAQLRWLQADGAARREIGAAGQRRTLAEHTYAHRMRELAAMLQERR